MMSKKWITVMLTAFSVLMLAGCGMNKKAVTETADSFLTAIVNNDKETAAQFASEDFMKFVLIGAGQRGMIYAKYARERGHQIAAVAEPDEAKRQIAGDVFGIPEHFRFHTGKELLEQPKLGDAAIIATMDRDHFQEAVPAMEKGYHLLLEKPISPVPEETLAIEETALRTGRHVSVCHVLRYSPFFRELKNAAAGGKIGRVITIQHNENIGNFHIAHSFVRGNWRRSELASPLIMQKSCHDMDLLVWLAGSGCESIASFGDLTYFREENAPEGAARRCCDCPLKDTCRFSAYRCYLPLAGNWPAKVLTGDTRAALIPT